MSSITTRASQFDTVSSSQRLTEARRQRLISATIHSRSWAAAIQPQYSHLTRLPPEIRLQIYNDVLNDAEEQETIEVTPKDAKFTSSRPLPATTLQLVCRQFFVEVNGGSLLYKSRGFHFDHWHTVGDYLATVLPMHLEFISNIRITIWIKEGRELSDSFSKAAEAFEALSLLNNLSRLELEFLVDFDFLVVETCRKNDLHLEISESLLEDLIQGSGLREIPSLRSFGLRLAAMPVPEAFLFDLYRDYSVTQRYCEDGRLLYRLHIRYNQCEEKMRKILFGESTAMGMQ